MKQLFCTQQHQHVSYEILLLLRQRRQRLRIGTYRLRLKGSAASECKESGRGPEARRKS